METLKNYYEFNELFKFIKGVFERKGNIIDDKTASITKTWFSLDKTRQLANDAIIEVRHLIFEQNNNSRLVMDHILSDCNEFENWIETLGRTNNLIIGTNEIGFYNLDQELIETEAYEVFCDIHFYYLIFYEPLIKMLKLETKAEQKEVNEIAKQKIKWLGTPSQFSFIFLELVKKGFIEQPTYRSETSPSRFAELCFKNFEIGKTTVESLKTEFKNGSSLGPVNRAKFDIPEKDNVTDKRSGPKNKKQ